MNLSIFMLAIHLKKARRLNMLIFGLMIYFMSDTKVYERIVY